MNAQRPAIAIAFLFLCIVTILFELAIWTYFKKYGDVSLKRRLQLPFAISNFICMLAILAWMGLPLVLFPVAALVSGFMTYWHMRSIRFCHACSLSIQTYDFFDPPAYCPHCGTKLDP